jgi:hypothetical protein
MARDHMTKICAPGAAASTDENSEGQESKECNANVTPRKDRGSERHLKPYNPNCQSAE